MLLTRQYGPSPNAIIAAVPSVQYWVDAGKITGVADGGAIAASDVVDQSAQARGAFSAVVNLTYRANAGNGKPAIEFNGTDSYGRGPSFALSQAATIFIVFKRMSSATLPRFFDGNTVNQMTLNSVAVTNKYSPICMQDGGANVPYTDTSDLNIITMVECYFNGASSTIREGGNNASSAANPGTTGWTTGPIFGAAGGLNAGFFCNYQLLECVACGSTLSASDKTAIRSALTQKHALVTRGLLLCDGNSLTEGTGSTGGNTYPAQLLALLGGASNYRLLNYGVGGQTTQQMSSDAATQIDPKRDLWARPLCLAWEIGNDILLNALTGAQAYANFVTYCQGRQAAGFTVIAMTVMPRVDLTGAAETARTDANTLLRANWATFCSALVDVAADSRLQTPTDETYFYTDHIHLNNTGYGIVASLVNTALAGIP